MKKIYLSILSLMMVFSVLTLPVVNAAVSNVALNKPIIASSVESAMAMNTADKAIDGLADTRWSCNAMKSSSTTEQDTQTPQWLVIDLEAETTTVSLIKIDFFKKVWASHYEIQTADSNDGSTQWTSLKTIQRAGGSVADNYQENITDVTTLKRYVRFYFHKVNVNAGGTGVSISEITINGTQSGVIEKDEVEALDYHRTFTNDITGIETLYGSGVTISNTNNALQLNYSATRAGVVDKSIDHKVASGTFEAVFTPAQDSKRFGMILRANANDQKIYVGTENNSSTWFWEYWNGSDNKWSSMFSGPSLAANQEVILKVKLLGTKISLWVNDTLVFSETMSGNVPMEAGYFGFDKNTNAGNFSVKSMSFKEQLQSASDILVRTASPDEITKASTQVTFGDVHEDYEINVIGSTNKHVIDQNGNITLNNIVEKEVEILVEAKHKEDATDSARKNFTVAVPAKCDDALIFPSVALPNVKPNVLPALQEWYGTSGSFVMNKETKLLYSAKDQEIVSKAITAMNEDLAEIKGYTLASDIASTPTTNSIYFEVDDRDVYDVKKEGYYIEIREDVIKVHANTYTGILYATVTLEQIMTTSNDGNVPCGIIRDYPDYEIRGVMFDVGRIPHRISYLQDYTRIFKWYKLNEFHLHLNDDFHYSPTAQSTGWNVWSGMHRLESDVYPSLIERQIYTGDQFTYFNEEYADPTYSKEEFIALTKMANDNGIDLIAELDTPSHATAYIEYARNNPDNISWLGEINTTTSSAFNNSQMLALDVNSSNATEKQHALNARKFIEELYADYLGGDNPTFLSDTVHVGADEYWDKSNPEAFRDYTNFLADLMASYGKTARMWGAQKMFPGNTPISPENIVIDVWATYEEDPNARLQEGYRVVNVPQPYLYTTPGRDHKEMIGEEYLFEQWDVNIFNGDVKAEPGEPLLLGAKAALWGDEFREGIVEADLHERMLRAAAMTAEKTWGGREVYNDYLNYQMTFDKVKEGPNTRIAHNIDSKTSLVASYDFANVEGNVVKDTSGNGYDAKITNGEVQVVDGESFLVLNGNGVLETPLETIGYPYTVSFDIAANGNNANATLFEGYDGKLLAQGSDGTITIQRSFYTQSSGYQLSTVMKHIDIVGTAQNTKIYVDGQLVKMFANVNEAGNLDDYWTTFVLPLEKIAHKFNGLIGNINVYNKAFSYDAIGKDANTVENVNVALNANVYTNRLNHNNPSLNSGEVKRHPAWKAVDGDKNDSNTSMTNTDPHSYYLSSNHANDELIIDLGKVYTLNGIAIQWNNNQYATAYKIFLSEDGNQYEEALNVTGNNKVDDARSFDAEKTARFVKFQGVSKNANYYGIREFEVFAPVSRLELNEAITNANDAFVAKVAQSICENPVATTYDIEVAMELLSNLEVPLTAVENLTAKDTNYKTITLTWDKAQGATAYDVYRKAYDSDEFKLYKTVADTTLAVSGVMTGKEYAFYVVAKNETEEAEASETVTQATTLHGKVKLNIEKASTATFKLSWNKIDGATRYIVYRKRNDDKMKKVLTLGAKETEYTTAELPFGDYQFILKAGRYDSKDRVMTDASNTVKGNVKELAPSVKLTAGSKSVKVAWSKMEGVTHYQVYRATSADGKYTKLITTTDTSYTAKSLKSGKKYFFKVRGYKTYKSGDDVKYTVYTPYSTIKSTTAK